MKKKKRLIVIASLFFVFCLIFLGFDGLKIITLSWMQIPGRVLEAEIVEYPINSRYKGTLRAYYSNALVEYSIQDQKYKKTLIIDKKVKVNDVVRIRLNPKNIEQVSASEVNIQLYFILIPMIIFFLVGLLVVLIQKE